MLDWTTCVETFHQVVESNSFSNAARKLYTTASAISKRISWLEEELGTQLFKRSTRQIILTESGEALYNRSKPLLQEWEDMKGGLKSLAEEPEGNLSLALPPAFGHLYVLSLIPSFLAQYPKVSVDLNITVCPQSFEDKSIDIFISYERFVHNRNNLHQIPICTLVHKLYAAPSYLKNKAIINNLDDLAQHHCLTNRALHPNDVWTFETGEVQVRSRFHSNNTRAAVVCAVDGLGILFTSPLLICEEIRSQKLVPVLPEYASPPDTLYAFYPKMKYTPRKFQVFLNYLQKNFHIMCENPERQPTIDASG